MKAQATANTSAHTLQWTGRDLVSIRDLSREEIDQFLDYAQQFVPVAAGEKHDDGLRGKILATLFYEPSTRTRLSFEAAMHRLGGRAIGFSNPYTSSDTKGETLADTVRVVDGLCDAIVLRHPKEGAARLAAEFSNRPVINAGDGAGEHPTQTLLDLFTIKQEFGRVDGHTVVLLGDLKYGRTVHSLATALAQYESRLVLVSPASLQMPDEVVNACRQLGAQIETTSELDAVVPEADVLYATRIQHERFPDPEEYRRVQGSYRITNAVLARAKKNLIVMHPLPRKDEIAPEVDAGPHARYFQQSRNGLPVRMALLKTIMRGSE